MPILVITVKRGGILIGAFNDDDTMVGFVYSLPGIKKPAADAVVAHAGRALTSTAIAASATS